MSCSSMIFYTDFLFESARFLSNLVSSNEIVFDNLEDDVNAVMVVRKHACLKPDTTVSDLVEVRSIGLEGEMFGNSDQLHPAQRIRPIVDYWVARFARVALKRCFKLTFSN